MVEVAIPAAGRAGAGGRGRLINPTRLEVHSLQLELSERPTEGRTDRLTGEREKKRIGPIEGPTNSRADRERGRAAGRRRPRHGGGENFITPSLWEDFNPAGQDTFRFSEASVSRKHLIVVARHSKHCVYVRTLKK